MDIKSKFQTFIKYKYSPYIFIILVYIPFFLFAQYCVDDISMFTLSDFSLDTLLEYTKDRYYTWTSRNILELFTVFFCTKTDVHIWSFINLIINLLLFKMITYYFSDGSQKEKWLFALGLQFIPAGALMETGLVSIATTYTWPITFALISFIPIVNFVKKKPAKWYMWLLSYPLFFIAGNMELFLLFMLIIYMCMIIYLIMDKRKLNGWFIIYGLLGLTELANFLYCPGNRERAGEGINDLNILWKIIRGFLCTIQYFISNYGFQVFFLTFELMCLCFFYKKLKNVALKISWVTLVIYTGILSYVLWIFFYIEMLPRPLKLVFYNSEYHKDEITLPEYIIICLICLGIFVLITYTFVSNKTDKLYTFKTERLSVEFDYSYVIAGIFVASVLTRVVMGFSPTVFIESERQSLLCDYGFIIIMVYLFRYYKDRYKLTKEIYVLLALVSTLRNILLSTFLKL